VDEGPFGEWSGYYGNLGLTPVPEPVIRVKAVYHRHDPILTCSSPAVPPGVNSLLGAISRAAAVWGALDKIGIPEIKGVWCPEEAGSHLVTIVSIKQMYAGHSRDVGLIASQLAGNHSRQCIVVDDDIDPSDLKQVVWAIATRADPERAIQTLPYCASSSADPIIPEEEKRKAKAARKPLLASRVLIDACRPYEHKADWYPITKASPELSDRIRKKWGAVFRELC
jgi:UbiD family decarboxylase